MAVEVLPEIKRVNDLQDKIEKRNAEIRLEKVSANNPYEEAYGKLPTLERCESVNGSSPIEMREKCLIVFKMARGP